MGIFSGCAISSPSEQAAERDDVVDCIRQFGAHSLSIRDSDNKTPLMIATDAIFVEAVEALLECGADANATGARGQTALMRHVTVHTSHASTRERTRIFRLLVSRTDLSVRDHMRFTVLHHAVRTQDTETISILLAHGADATAVCQSGTTALHRLTTVLDQSNSPDIVDALVKHGADINAQTWKDEETPLMLFVKRGFNNTLCLKLLKLGADPTIRSASGNTVFHALTRPSFSSRQEPGFTTDPEKDAFAIFIRRGVNINALNTHGNTCLHDAISTAIDSFNGCYPFNNKSRTRYMVALIRHLLFHGADADARGAHGQRPRWMACKITKLKAILADPAYTRNHIRATISPPCPPTGIVWTLSRMLQTGNPEGLLPAEQLALVNPAHCAPLLIALCGRTVDLDRVTQLLEHGAPVNACIDSHDNTLLSLACAHQNWELVDLLLKHGATIRPANNKGIISLCMDPHLFVTDSVTFVTGPIVAPTVDHIIQLLLVAGATVKHTDVTRAKHWALIIGTARLLERVYHDQATLFVWKPRLHHRWFHTVKERITALLVLGNATTTPNKDDENTRVAVYPAACLHMLPYELQEYLFGYIGACYL